ncbi:hypothetical protein G9U51_10950 [Calidifontibacter sp. DB0510]|uniref:Low temperature requirement protein A n=1 Tax=Metallococcus carri TaxID=1656884 RepID=A0A967B2F1_9MICO|nr:low temperature requirement protein A [Metallococcus carri]NHN56293.1 hypothetical protein [Metallococcus carri]NOP38655.1 hypothetical protein [Calidifontibacter sp. DB2511S]
MALVLTDEDLARLRPRDAVDWMLEALRLRAGGDLMAPPRLRADLGDGALVVTAGRGPRWYGYRAYDTIPTPQDQQVVVVHDATTGEVLAVHVGNDLGPARTGALGGAAAALLGPTAPATVGLVGAGSQAWTQLWALSAVVDIVEVRVASRAPASREALAQRATEVLGLRAYAASSQGLLGSHGWTLDAIAVVVAGIVLTFGMWWVYFISPFGDMLHARRSSSFIFGYGHMVIFGAIAATGAGLHLVGLSLEDKSKLTEFGAITALAAPIAIFLLAVFGIFDGMAGRVDRIHPPILIASMLVLAASVGLAALGLDVAVSLFLLMLAPWVVVVSYEWFGHRYVRDAVHQLQS